jgi:hypothetical protein
MKSFTQFLNESGNGDCMDTAGRCVAFYNLRDDSDPLNAAVKKKGGTVKNIRLVHALVKGQGPVAGKRFAHAWVEVGNTVFDFSNGNSAVIDKTLYYAMGHVHPEEKGAYVKYTQAQTIKKISSSHHWGPWDGGLDLSLEILESKLTPIDEAKNVLPKSKRLIGKHKVKITKGDIEDLFQHSGYFD